MRYLKIKHLNLIGIGFQQSYMIYEYSIITKKNEMMVNFVRPGAYSTLKLENTNLRLKLEHTSKDM